MNCLSCGQVLSDDARFCLKCGTPVPERRDGGDPLRAMLQQALGTHYHVVRELGRGGMGAVYLAHESGLDREVAIKVLPPDRAEVSQHRERFRREARTAARLSHPNIVPLYSFGEHEGMLYYVMGYVQGESLADALVREGKLAEHEAKRILIAVADALHYAHQQGVLHRDVKPQNILLEAGSGRPLLTDFGIAKVTTDDTTLTSVGAVVGTPAYVSPEQASGSSDVGPRSDVYSLGIVGYEMLAGSRPFDGHTPAEIIVKRLTVTPSQAPMAAAGTSPVMMDVIMRCLHRDPASRWPDAAALVRVLTHVEEESRDTIESIGLLTFLLSYFALMTQLSWLLSTDRGIALQVGHDIANALVVFAWLIAGSALLYSRWQGLGWRQSIQRVFREPPIWRWWYPRACRRSANVWNRLPEDVKRVRYIGVGVLAYVALFLVPTGVAITTVPDAPWVRGGVFSLRTALLASVGALILILAFGAWLGWSAGRRLKSRGLTGIEVQRVLTESPLSLESFWNRPAIQAILVPPPAGPAVRPGIVPSDSDDTV